MHASVVRYLAKSEKLPGQSPAFSGYNMFNNAPASVMEQHGLVKQGKSRVRKRKAYLAIPKNRKPTLNSRAKTKTPTSEPPTVILNGGFYPTLLAAKRKTLSEPATHSDSKLQYSNNIGRPILTHTSTIRNQPSNRYHVFSFRQVKRLDEILHTMLTIAPRPITWDFMIYHPTSFHTERCSAQSVPTTENACSKNHLSHMTSLNQDCNCNHVHCEPQRTANKSVSNCNHSAPFEMMRCMPFLNIPLLQLIRTIRDRLTDEQITVREIRLNGGAAGCVIDDSETDTYSDLDLIFSIDLSNTNTFTKIKSIVFSSVSQFLADTFASGKAVYSSTQSTCFHRPKLLQRCGCYVSSRNTSLSECEPTHTSSQGRIVEKNNDRSSPETKDSKANHGTKKTENEQITRNMIENKQTSRSIVVENSPLLQRNTESSKLCFTQELCPKNQVCKNAIYNCTCSFCLPTSTASHLGWDRILRDESYVKHYIQKMVRVHKQSSKTADSWSLFTLGFRTPDGGKTIDIKFVDRMHRQFEFTVDSFQIVLDSLLTFYEISRQPISENFYPTVVAESVSGGFTDALSHLRDRLIVTARPEEIRGGGLLKYCKLLVEGYRPPEGTDVLSMERYMCSRFFIDFPDIVSQHHRLAYYLANHFEDNDALKSTYLQILHEVVSHSTICLMTHERQQTLCLIRMFLQDELTKEEAIQSVVHLEEFSTDKWALDSVYYGTNFFPKQLFLFSSPVPPAPTVNYEDCKICKTYSTQIEPIHDNQGPSKFSYANCNNNGNPIVPLGASLGTTFVPNPKPIQPTDCNGEIVVLSNKLATVTTGALKMAVKQKLSDVEELTDAETETSLTSFQSNSSPEIQEESGGKDDPNSSDVVELSCNGVEEQANHPSPSDELKVSTISSDQLEAYPQKMYYIPQVVTYFPAAEFPYISSPNSNVPIIDQETAYNQTPNKIESFTTIAEEILLPRFIPHYHAGIILPSIEQVTSSAMNHYVGIPCSSDVQYTYSNFATNSTFLPTDLSLPLYLFEQDPSYCLYSSPMLPSAPSPLLLTYPM